VELNLLAYLDYLHQTLGIQYLTYRSNEAPSLELSEKHVIWQKPSFKPRIIFLNQDPESNLQNSTLENLFVKIVKALNLSLEQVWYVESHNRSLMDFLAWLKSQNLTAPLVVMKKDLDIRIKVQNAGVFNWVECYSLDRMESQPQLKKTTWEVLKLLTEKK
jgi:hypothetical protein